jgi:hypothetical protein
MMDKQINFLQWAAAAVAVAAAVVCILQ